MNLRFRRSGLDFSRRRRKVNKTLAKEVGTWIGEIAIAVLFALVLVYFVGYRADVVGPSMPVSYTHLTLPTIRLV